MDLIELKEQLRQFPKADRQSLCVGADGLAIGYHRLCTHAPRRAQRYLSPQHFGITSSGDWSNRIEEHLAAGLFLRRELILPNGERLRLIDYRFPLKSVRADRGIGKIDLLGLYDDGTLAVVELKVEGNLEDRRIGLAEGLIYAAVVEANLEQIAKEVLEVHRRHVARARPKVLVIATSAYWSNARTYPSTEEFQRLVDEAARAIPAEITLMRLNDAHLVELSLDRRPPRVQGHAFLSLVIGDEFLSLRVRPTSQAAYLEDLFRTFWAYRRSSFEPDDDVFDPRYVEGTHPPVFRQTHSDRNLINPPAARSDIIAAIAAMISPKNRHRAFASMRSSQALTQSVFAGLAQLDRLDALEDLEAEDGCPAFFDSAAGHELTLEHRVSTLDEPRPTSVDAFFNGPTKVTVEVKFTEPEFGRCSRPLLRPQDPSFARGHCDGSFTIQRNRTKRCSLSELGVNYWQFVPHLFVWTAEEDYRPCPLNFTYQLIRNVLAACVGDGAHLDTEKGHALVIYDARNPAFHSGGLADAQWWAAVRALRYPRLLRRVSWQRIAAHLDQFRDLDWLTGALGDKYGIRCCDPLTASVPVA
jgi:hypothetical protein